jgi:hypothetical protein
MNIAWLAEVDAMAKALEIDSFAKRLHRGFKINRTDQS